MIDALFNIIVVAFLTIILFAGINALIAFPFMWCWNYVIVYFGFKGITWGQAWCILFLIACTKSISTNSKTKD